LVGWVHFYYKYCKLQSKIEYYSVKVKQRDGLDVSILAVLSTKEGIIQFIFSADLWKNIARNEFLHVLLTCIQ
jgi:hypothetical protein